MPIKAHLRIPEVVQDKLLNQSLMPTLPHPCYLAVAKTRAKVLHAASLVMMIPRPMLLVGKESYEELCEMMVNEGAKNVLIVTDAILKGLGICDKATTFFDEHHIQYELYDGILPDPTFKVVNEGLALSEAAHCDAILAIGGGSVIDAAKMIAVSQGSKRDPRKLMGLLKVKKCMPLYCIPTTAGTGSEATLGAVISDDKTHQKSISIDPKMVPIASAIDSTILAGLPPRATAETGIDALTHGLECWMSLSASGETDYYSASAVSAVFKYLPTAYKDGKNLEAREEMGVAAHYGGIAINKAGLGYVHAIAHQLGAFYGIPHGRANAIVLPYILDMNQQASEKRLAALARKIGVIDNTQPSRNSNDRQLAEYFIQQVKDLIDEVDIDRSIEGMKTSDFNGIAKAAAKEVSDTYSVPTYLTRAQINKILMSIKQVSEKADSKLAKAS